MTKLEELKQKRAAEKSAKSAKVADKIGVANVAKDYAKTSEDYKFLRGEINRTWKYIREYIDEKSDYNVRFVEVAKFNVASGKVVYTSAKDEFFAQLTSEDKEMILNYFADLEEAAKEI